MQELGEKIAKSSRAVMSNAGDEVGCLSAGQFPGRRLIPGVPPHPAAAHQPRFH